LLQTRSTLRSKPNNFTRKAELSKWSTSSGFIITLARNTTMFIATQFLDTSALGKECLRVLHNQDLAQGAALVSGVFVMGFDDAIADPIAEVARLVSVPL
jgi:hypothetical protein